MCNCILTLRALPKKIIVLGYLVDVVNQLHNSCYMLSVTLSVNLQNMNNLNNKCTGDNLLVHLLMMPVHDLLLLDVQV